MDRRRILKLVLAFASVVFATTKATRGAELLLTRQSRLATSDEITGGVPSGSVIHDFFLTSPADLLSLNSIDLNVPLFQHASGSDVNAPSDAFSTVIPGLSADSFFTLPGSTLTLGGGFGGGHDAVWGDLSNDGPQNQFHFGRLTSNQSGQFAGSFALRGEWGPVNVPFQFELPDASAGWWDAPTTLAVSYAPDVPPPSPPPMAPPQLPAPPHSPAPPPIVPVPYVPPQPPALPTNPDFLGTLTFTRGTCAATAAEVAAGVPSGGLIHEFFVSSTTDILSIGNVSVTAPLYQNPLGSDNAAPVTAALSVSPAVGADSFLATPGGAMILGGGFEGQGGGLWGDFSDDGGQSNFLFSRLTTDSPGEFSGVLAVAGGQGPIEIPFQFALPGSASELPLSEADTFFSVQYSLQPPAPPAPYVPPEPIPPPHAPHVPVNNPIAETPPITPPFDPIAQNPPAEPPTYEVPIFDPIIDVTPPIDPIAQDPPQSPDESPIITFPRFGPDRLLRGIVWIDGSPMLVDIDGLWSAIWRSDLTEQWINPEAAIDVGLPFGYTLDEVDASAWQLTNNGLMAYDGLTTAGLNGRTFQTAFAQALSAMLDGAPPAPEPSSSVLALLALVAANATRSRRVLRLRRSR